MRTLFTITALLCGVFLLLSARQVSRDSKRANGALVGKVSPGMVRIAGVAAVIMGLIWLLY